MQKYKVDNDIYIAFRDDIVPSSSATLKKREITFTDYKTGKMKFFKFIYVESLFHRIQISGLYNVLLKQICKKPVQFDVVSDPDLDDLEHLPLLTIDVVLGGVTE